MRGQDMCPLTVDRPQRRYLHDYDPVPAAAGFLSRLADCARLNPTARRTLQMVAGALGLEPGLEARGMIIVPTT